MSDPGHRPEPPGESIQEGVRRIRDFVCVHGDSLSRTEAIRAQVAAALAAGTQELRSQEFTASALVMSLFWDFDVDHVEIGADQWFGVFVERKDLRITVQCDVVEDGLAGAWRILRELVEGAG